MKTLDKENLHMLFQAMHGGEKEEFNKLYEGYKGLVYKIAFSILKNKENCEDVVQVIFMKIYQMPKEKLPTGKESTWLYSLTKNETINFMKKIKQEFSIDAIYSATYEDEYLNDVMDRDAYNRLINKLNEKEQEIVSLKIIGGLSFKEIGQVLNMPIGTVQWHYYKAVNILKLFLSNVSAFIITMLLYLTSRTYNKMAMLESSDNEAPQVNGSTQNRPDSIDSMKNTFSPDTAGTGQSVDDVAKDIYNEPGALLMSIAGVFLVLSIIFGIIYAKYQQKARKKLSK